MELQDRSRSYPSLPQVPQNLVMGMDGRIQYAPLPQQAPHQPVFYPMMSAAPQSQEAFSIQKSLNCWGKSVRVLSGIILLLNLISFGFFLFKISSSESSPSAKCKFWAGLRIFLFFMLCIVAKLGMKAGKIKSSATSKKFLKSVVILGIILLLIGGFIAYKKMNYKSWHKDQKGDVNNENVPQESNDPNGPDVQRLLKEQDTEERVCGKEYHEEKEKNHHEKGENMEEKAQEGKIDSEELEKKEHKGQYKGPKKCAVIGLAVGIVAYSVVLYMAYKLNKVVKNYELLVQRGNVPMMPAFVQQPVMSYVPGYFPANVPMGSPLQQ